MLRKFTSLSLLTLIYLGLVGFSPAEETELVWNGPVGWTAFAIVLTVILVVAILLILQSRQTPANVAAYHLDQPGEGHGGHDSHAASGEEPAAVREHRASE